MEILGNLFKDFGKIFNEDSPAFDTPTHILEAMWQVRWGSEWITAEAFTNEFWQGALLQLLNQDLVESHRLITAPDGNSGLVYRLKKHD